MGAKRPLPANLIEKLVASRHAHSGLFNTRQIFLALLDQTIHTLPSLPLPAGLSFASLAAATEAKKEEGGEAEATTQDASATTTSTTTTTTSSSPLAALLEKLPLDPAGDTATILAQLHDSVLQIPLTPGTNFAASFGHLVGGYDSLYFGYLWSEVFADDMVGCVFAKPEYGLLSPVAGYRYRVCILAPGGARDAVESLRAFLGREPSNESFLRLKGIGK